MVAVLLGSAGLIVFSRQAPVEEGADWIWEQAGETTGRIAALRVLTDQAEVSSLDREVAGRNEILVISPACPACEAHLVAETDGLENAPPGVRARWKERLLLVARDQGPPSEPLQQALDRARQAGARIVYATTPDIFFELDIRRVPALLKLEGERWQLDPTVH